MEYMWSCVMQRSEYGSRKEMNIFLKNYFIGITKFISSARGGCLTVRKDIWKLQLFFSLPVLSITFDTIKDQSPAKPHNAGILIWFVTSLQNKKFLPWNLIFVFVKASRLFEIKAKVQWIIFLLWRKWTINVKFSVLRYKPGRCL